MFHFFFENEIYASEFRNCLPQNYTISKSNLSANLQAGDSNFEQHNYSGTIVYLESILSAIHDFIDSLTEELTY